MTPAGNKANDDDKLQRERLRAAAHQTKLWVGEDFLFRYQTEDGMGLGQIRRDAKLEWDAWDLQLMEGNGALFIGHYPGEKQAKKAVEDYWSMIG